MSLAFATILPHGRRRLVQGEPPADASSPQPTSGELLFAFHVARTHTFWSVELRDRGAFGVEVQFLDPVDVRGWRVFQIRRQSR